MYPLVTNCTSDMGTTRNARRMPRHALAIRAFAWLSLLLYMGTMANCATQSLPPAVIQRLCTAKSSNSCSNWVYAGESCEIRIEGENILETWQVDLGKESQPRTKKSFRAWIGPVELLDVEKLPYSSTSQLDVLQGELPGTLDVGFYPVRIETPSAATVSFPGPVSVRTPLFVSVTMEKLHAPIHDTLRMIVTIENKSTAALGNVQIALTQGGTGSVLLPPPAPAFSLDGESSMDVALDLVGASVGQPQIQIEASAVTGQGLEVKSNEPKLLTLDIMDEASCLVDVQAQPQQLSIGQQLTIMATVRNTGGVALDDSVLVIRKTEGQGQLQWSTIDTSRRIGPGEETVFVLRATAIGAGTVKIYPVITGIEAISERPLEFSPSAALEVDIIQD